MCVFDIDRIGFPLVAGSEEEDFFHFFPLTRVQLEEAIAAGWLVEEKSFKKKPTNAQDLLSRGEVFWEEFLNLQEETPEHAVPIEIMLFPGGYKSVSQLVRQGLTEIDETSLYSLYLTGLKLEEYASLVQWLGGDRFCGGLPLHQHYHKIYYGFRQFPVRELIEKLLSLDGLNPRAAKMLEIFDRFKGIINGLPRDIFEMTGNYLDRNSERVLEFSQGKPLPGVDKDGYPSYFPVIAGESKLWPFIPARGKMRHLKMECHPLVGARGIFRERR